MAKRRTLSEHILYDEEYNSLSVEAQNLFIRLLAKSDDCGVVPVGEYDLKVRFNLPEVYLGRRTELVEEIVAANLGNTFEFNDKKFFLFKQESFRRYNSYILNKRKHSEWLGISAEEFDRRNWVDGSVKSEPLQGEEEQDYDEIVAEWNRFAEEVGLTKVAKLTPKRRAAVRSRLSEELFSLKNIFEKIRSSRGLRGENDRNWKVDFDFVFLSPHNYVKILEGKYDEWGKPVIHSSKRGAVSKFDTTRTTTLS